MDADAAFQSRTRLLLGEDAVPRLSSAHVLVLGLGGVGGAAAEMLCRAGIGRLTLVDGDRVDSSNRNRQLVALTSTIGRAKAEVLAERLRDIHPGVQLEVRNEFVTPETVDELLSTSFDYAVDAIDQLTAKVAFIAACRKHGIPLISSMGSGGRMDPEQIKRADLAQTHHCALARVVRRKLRELGITKGVEVIFSPEPVPETAIQQTVENDGRIRSAVGTISYLPNVFGCHCAAAVIHHLLSRPL